MSDKDGELIDMAFSKKRVDERKRWLRAFEQGTYLDHSVREVRSLRPPVAHRHTLTHHAYKYTDSYDSKM